VRLRGFIPVVELRRAIHREPESLATPKTQALILARAERIGIERVASGLGVMSGSVSRALVVPARPRRVAFADADAPLTEHAEVDQGVP
jgi:hypothetical protein